MCSGTRSVGSRTSSSGKRPISGIRGCQGTVSPVPRRLAEVADSFFRQAINELVPYEPGKPIEEVQRELGLDRIVKLASNEGQFGPFPEALEALERSFAELNRYPDGGAHRLRGAPAARHARQLQEVTTGSGADRPIGCPPQ